MKRFSLVLFLLSNFSLAKTSSQAARVAEMEETDASGYVLQTLAYAGHRLLEFKSRGKTVSFRFEDLSLTQVVCIQAPCPPAITVSEQIDFFRVGKSISECGSTLYKGQSRDGRKMVLLDHSTRMCDDFKSHVWELQISRSRKSIRSFRGNPKVEGDLKCEEKSYCTMIFMPATCSYKSHTVEGSNPCLAENNLKHLLCEQGITQVNEEEIVCNVTSPICPIPMCAAPPPNCQMVPSDELNEMGCPLYPCGTLVCNP